VLPWLVGAYLVAAHAQTAEEPSLAPPTAPAEGAATDIPGSAPPALPDEFVNWVEANIEFERLLAADELPAALPMGERMVALSEQEFGRNTRQTAEAYTRLAEAQRQAGDWDAAERNFISAIEIYRSIDGAFSPLVIAPLTSLGDTYHEATQYRSAVSAYSEARTVSRRAFGLLNEEQIAFLDRMSRSLLELNQSAEADLQQVEALRLVERNWPPESPQAVAAIYKYADWLRQRGLYQQERDQYARALRVIRTNFGKEDPRQVQPLVGIGNSFRNQRIPEGQGVGALRDALALLLAQSNRDELAIATVLRDLGDWEVAFNKAGYDGAEYRRAWQLLGNVADGEQLRRTWFTGPTFLLREPISLRWLSDEPSAPSGHVLVRFDLDAAGQSGNETVLESEPPGLKDEAVLRQIRRSRFRPQMENGELVPSEALALLFNFRYRTDALAETSADTSERSR
jgi:tetratricopeptide (TPR) repeat protein